MSWIQTMGEETVKYKLNDYYTLWAIRSTDMVTGCWVDRMEIKANEPTVIVSAVHGYGALQGTYDRTVYQGPLPFQRLMYQEMYKTRPEGRLKDRGLGIMGHFVPSIFNACCSYIGPVQVLAATIPWDFHGDEIVRLMAQVPLEDLPLIAANPGCPEFWREKAAERLANA